MNKGIFSLMILTLIGQLLYVGQAAAEPLNDFNHKSTARSFSVSVPERNRLILISLVPVSVDGVTVGQLAAYDDATTRRAADYLELYDNAGDLVAVGWFDKFGIERTAVDRGLLEGDPDLRGFFVVLTGGDAV